MSMIILSNNDINMQNEAIIIYYIYTMYTFTQVILYQKNNNAHN